jgi:hypothetical protein
MQFIIYLLLQNNGIIVFQAEYTAATILHNGEIQRKIFDIISVLWK